LNTQSLFYGLSNSRRIEAQPGSLLDEALGQVLEGFLGPGFLAVILYIGSAAPAQGNPSFPGQQAVCPGHGVEVNSELLGQRPYRFEDFAMKGGCVSPSA